MKLIITEIWGVEQWFTITFSTCCRYNNVQVLLTSDHVYLLYWPLSNAYYTFFCVFFQEAIVFCKPCHCVIWIWKYECTKWCLLFQAAISFHSFPFGMKINHVYFASQVAILQAMLLCLSSFYVYCLHSRQPLVSINFHIVWQSINPIYFTSQIAILEKACCCVLEMWVNFVYCSRQPLFFFSIYTQ